MKRVLCLAFALMAPFVSAYGAERYRVKLLLHPGVDSGAVAKRLAAVYQGELQTPVDAEGTFIITLPSAAATLLARDPQVVTLAAPEVVPDAATSWSLGTFDYDHAGNIKQIGTREYVYDREGRLSYETIGTQKQQQLTYDGFGNIRTISEGSKVQTVGARATTNRADVVSAVPNYMYGTYDGAGNMLSTVTTTETSVPRTYTYTYDALNVMTNSTTDASRAYVYNVSDERIGIITLTGPNGTEVSSQWTIRDLGGQVLRRFSREGSQWRWMQDYIYRDGRMLASESNDQFKTLHYHLDHLGTPRLITGNGGAEVARHTYYPFGEEAPGSEPAVAEPKRFTGHERDSGGLDYMHARFYEYGMGRFLSVDPHYDDDVVIWTQKWNRYLYAANNPTRYVDPDGRGVYDFVEGVANGWSSSNLGNANRVVPRNADYRRGQAVGDAIAVVTGAIESWAGAGTVVTAAGGEVLSGGAVTPVAVPAAIVGGAMLLHGATTTATALNNLSSANQTTSGGSADGVPQKAQDVVEYAKKNDGATRQGYVGNRPYENDGRQGSQILPQRDASGNPITYREYDVNAYQKGVNRGKERVVIGSDGSAYYTDSHYQTFVKMN